MTAVPVETAVTSPDSETLPTLGVNDTHVTDGAETILPEESFATARA
jgi:hypothetical protein